MSTDTLSIPASAGERFGHEWRSPGVAYLEAHLRLLWDRAATLVAARRAAGAQADDAFRGLYISDDDAEATAAQQPPMLRAHTLAPGDADTEHGIGDADVLADHHAQAAAASEAGEDIRLFRLASMFDLDAADTLLLVAAAAPDIDRRFERLYGYLNDDVSQRRATVSLALELCGISTSDGSGRARLDPAGRLADAALVTIEEAERPALTRQLRVADRVVEFLLGDDSPAVEIADAAAPWVRGDVPVGGDLAAALDSGAATIYVQDATRSGALSWVGSTLAGIGVPTVALDASALAGAADQRYTARCARREALLCSAVLVVENFDAVSGLGRQQALAWTDGVGIAVLIGTAPWERPWSRRPPVCLPAPVLGTDDRMTIWRALAEPDIELTDAQWGQLCTFRLSPLQVAHTVTAARQRAAIGGRPVELADLLECARSQGGGGLERLARRLEPSAGFDAIVAPAPVLRQLQSIPARVHHRGTVLDAWAMGGASNRGHGVTALFAGESGTGKTLSAEAVAKALGFSLYVIDLSSVVDKYVGETEKKLEQIFREAEQVNGVLLFDEADAIFGKRSEVKAAQDRYANLEVAYLLQRMERFDGIAILTTNLRANIDDAFLRRLDVIVDFPVPERDDRRRIWQMQLPDTLPVADDIDLDFLAASFRLSGGNIRNIALAAAFAAAEDAAPVTMAHLIRATAAEYRKLGRMCVAGEFGPYFDLAQS